MKKTIIRIILLLFFGIPFVFLAMNEDATTGTLWFYLIMIIGFSVLCYGCIKTKNWWIVVIGNILSFTSSCIFAWNFQTPKWEYYFKPFLPNQLIIFETVIAFLIQIAFVIHCARKATQVWKMKKKTIRNIIITIVSLCLVWSAMVITDYVRCKSFKEPIFTIGTNRDQNGNGYYKCIGYEIRSVAREFNGNKFIKYDMQFSLFGRGRGIKKTIYDNYCHNLGLLGSDKETVLNYLEALKYVTPDVSGNQETYTEYVNGNDVKVMNMILYNDIVAGFEYEYDSLQAAYDFAKYLRKDLELTFGEKSTYLGMVQTNKDYFDNVKNVSELKSQYTYYEDWKAAFDYQKKENIDKMLEGKDYSRIDIHFELSVIEANKAIVSVRYIALP